MATLIIPNAYLVAINMESGGQEVTNVIGIRADFTNALNVATVVRDEWIKTGSPFNRLSTQVKMKNVTATDLSTANGDVAVVTSAATGGVTFTSHATNGSCMLVTYGGGTRSRSSKGRMYFGPLTEGMIEPDGRTVTPATITNFMLHFGQFHDGLELAGLSWCVISRKLSEARSFPKSSLGIQSIIATQRRRIRG